MPNSQNLESLILGFERAWQSTSPPDIADFLPQSWGEAERFRLLIELVCVDLEFRWRNAASTQISPKRTLADYVDTFRELKSLDELPLELIEEEYWVRHRWGDRPSHATFVGRFKRRRAEILDRLMRLDRGLHDETDCGLIRAPRILEMGLESGRQSSDADPRAPLLFSDYLLQEMIGAGRMGKVYRAWQRSLERPVAVKYLKKSFQRDPDAVERFINEAKTVSQFEHPGIVRIHGLGRTPGAGYFIAMELVDGSDMSHRLGAESIAVADAVRWMIQACEAIGHAHERGIIHCDLKPANLLLDRSGNVRVTDFGLARSIREEARPVDRIEGTAAFMAPEQISGWWGSMTARTDVYGIGAVFYALITGEPPYRGATIADVLARVVSGVHAISPIELRPDLTIAVNDICLRCLDKHPEHRYENVQCLCAALRESLRMSDRRESE